MKQIGNVKSNAKYNPDEARYPPPANLIDSERDSELEKYIRGNYFCSDSICTESNIAAAKYEFKTLMKRTASSSRAVAVDTKPVTLPKVSVLSSSSKVDRSAAVEALLGPSRSAASRASVIGPSRSNTTVATASGSTSSSAASVPSAKPVPTRATLSTSSSAPVAATQQEIRSVPQPVPPSSSNASGQTSLGGLTANSLPSLQSQMKTIDATLPLQVMTAPVSTPLPISTQTSYLAAPNPFHNLSASPTNPYASPLGQTTGISPGSFGSGMSPGPGTTGSLAGYSPAGLSPSVSTMTLQSTTPSPNPFTPQALPTSSSFGTQPNFIQSNYTAAPQQPQNPFGSQMYTGQHTVQQPIGGQIMSSQPQVQFAQQQTPMQMQPNGNPYLQGQMTPSPFMPGQMGGSPSPFATSQTLQQMNQMSQMNCMQQQPIQQQQGLGGTNPFTSWIQQPPAQQGGYSQQWGM